MSESVHTLGLAGITKGSKGSHCTVVGGRSKDLKRGCAEMLRSALLSVSIKRGVVIVGAISKVTVNITTTLSTLG